MQSRVPGTVVVLSIAFFSMSCAVSPETAARRQAVEAEIEAILSEPQDTDQPGLTQRCLADQDYRNFRAIDDRRLLFQGRRDELWINTLRTRCHDLRYGTVLVFRPRSGMRRLCELDTFEPTDWFAWPWYRRWPWRWGTAWGTGMMCTLGEFQRVTEAQVAAIEDLLQSE